MDECEVCCLLRADIESADATIDAKCARIAELEARCERYRRALRIIAGDEQCIDDTWSNETVARVALQDLETL